jgi:hypothetical protein
MLLFYNIRHSDAHNTWLSNVQQAVDCGEWGVVCRGEWWRGDSQAAAADSESRGPLRRAAL